MAGLKGDFISFTYNGKHSAEMGITRVSDGTRYNDNLLPTFQDKTAVINRDGTYFFNSNYTQKQFNINFAFDSLTETEYRNLRNWIGDKKPHDLIFDEQPYKAYKAKVIGNATIKTVCFDEEKELSIEESKKRNLISYPYRTKETTTSLNRGIDIKINNDGSLTLNGTVEKQTIQDKDKNLYLYITPWESGQLGTIGLALQPGKYHFSGLEGNGRQSSYRLVYSIYKNGEWNRHLMPETDIVEEIKPGETINCYIWIEEGTSVENITIMPLIYTNIERVYKGEGNIQFVAYEPFARSVYKSRDEYKNCSNLGEWINSAGLKTALELEEYDNYLTADPSFTGFKIYNPGDMETDFIITIPFSNKKISAGKLRLDENTEYQLEWSDITAIGNDYGIQINSKLNLFEGIDENGKKTGNVYNGYIKGGYFFKIPIILDSGFLHLFKINASETKYSGKVLIKYDYLYF